MKQVNLLIFDEAHHAKKNHAYARILKDYYHSEDTDARPRIFGMTASPVDAKADVALAVSALEAILDSKIATTTDMSLQEAVKKPWEGVISYPALTTPVASEIFQLANKHLGPMQIFQPILDKWPILARELGTVCADQCLLNKLSDKKLSRYEIAIEQKFHSKFWRGISYFPSFAKPLRYTAQSANQAGFLRTIFESIFTSRFQLPLTHLFTQDDRAVIRYRSWTTK